jgi:PAS domain S-box-containing protein
MQKQIKALIVLFTIATSIVSGQEKPGERLTEARTLLIKGQVQEAEAIASALLRTETDDVIVGEANLFMANLCASQSRKPEQINFLFDALTHFNTAHNAHLQAETKRQIGQFYSNVKLYSHSERFLSEALAIAAEQKDTLALINTTSNIAQLKLVFNDTQEALKLFDQAIALSEKLNYHTGLFQNWNRKSYAYIQLQQPAKMVACMKTALHYLPSNTDTLGIMYADLGLAYLYNAQYDSSEKYQTKGLAYLEQGKNTEQQMIVNHQLYELSLKQKNYPKAVDYLRRDYDLNGRVYTQELKTESSLAESRYNALASSQQLSESKKRSNHLLLGLLGFIFLTVGFAAVSFWSRKVNRKIRSQAEKIKLSSFQLAESEKLYRNLFENSLAVITIHRLNGEILDVNQTTTQLFGKSKDEMRRTKVTDYLHPSSRHLFAEYKEHIEQSGEVSGWMKVLDANGNPRILRYQNRVIVSENNEAIVIGLAYDQTGFFTAREDSEQKKNLLEFVMRNSPDTLCLLKDDATVIYKNRFGNTDAQHLIGKNILPFLPKNEAETFYSNLRKAVETGEPLIVEEESLGKYFLTKWIPIVNHDKVSEVLSISTDISEVKNAQSELKKAKEEAEESNRLKTVFLGSLSHEVRTPLQGILGFAEILEKPDLPEAKRLQYLSIIKRRSADMLNIIESLLDFASFESGEIGAFPVKVNLYEAIETTFEKALQDVNHMGGKVRVLLQNELTPGDTALIDPQHLYQVLTNLLSNALKFTSKGIVTLRAESKEDLYHISVVDTGLGIASDRIEHIFKPFRQAHEGLSRAKGGIGLGLSICKIMVEMWGSKIEVESELGKGSIFRFTIAKPAEVL